MARGDRSPRDEHANRNRNALLEAALITVAPSAPPPMDPTTSAATAPRRIICMCQLLLSVEDTPSSVTRPFESGM